MTYIIGWKNKNCVFLSGDMAIKRNSKLKLKDTKSIFGEDIINEEDVSVNEECLKVFKINQKVVLAFSGEVKPALDFIEQIKNSISEEAPLDTIEFIVKNYESKIDEFTIFIGLIDKEEKARLFSFKSCTNQLLESEEPIQSGSLNQEHRDLSEIICRDISKNTIISEDDELAIVNTFHQNLLIQEKLLTEAVGGIFFGIKLCPSGVSWQKDTSLIVYDFKEGMVGSDSFNPAELFENSALVNVVERDNAIRYSSPFLKKGYTRNVVYNCLDTPQTLSDFNLKKEMIIDWHQKWYKETNQVFDNKDVNYFGFISRDKGLIPRVAVYSKERLKDLNVKIESTGHGNFVFKSIKKHSIRNIANFINMIRPRLDPDEGQVYDLVFSTQKKRKLNRGALRPLLPFSSLYEQSKEKLLKYLLK
ncbi:MAG: hypothetical protein DWQ02_10525 [Bacteroidetes bacterium]|nr:MAG: hypothetical protein DWQ02_10525 [Bacteroidota bacterium]